eukprot:jgi/Chrzof1/13528/Cz08g00330.t1
MDLVSTDTLAARVADISDTVLRGKIVKAITLLNRTFALYRYSSYSLKRSFCDALACKCIAMASLCLHDLASVVAAELHATLQASTIPLCCLLQSGASSSEFQWWQGLHNPTAFTEVGTQACIRTRGSQWSRWHLTW